MTDLEFDFEKDLNKEELDYIKWTLENINEEHKEAVRQWLEAELVDDDNDLEKAKKALIDRYANEIGGHEAGDRAWLAMEHWGQYIQNHPVVLMDKEAYRMATIAYYLMMEVYQKAMCKFIPWPDDSPKKDESGEEAS